MSTIHPSHRRVRHLRQIVCRGIQRTDPEGCFYVISDNGKELYCSGVSRDCHNPHWDALPVGFLDEHSNTVAFSFHVHGWSTSELLYSCEVDMRSLQFLNKTFAGLPALKPVATVLFRCQDGVYDTTGGIGIPQDDDWVMIKEVVTSGARQEKATVDGIQGSGMVLASLKIQLEMLQHRFQQVQWEADNSVPCSALSPPSTAGPREIVHKQALAAELRRAIAERKALHAQRATVVQSHSKVNDAVLEVGASAAGVVDSLNSHHLDAVRERRRVMMGGLKELFVVTPSDNRINGCLIPEREGFPETSEHSIALGYIVHLLSIVCEVAALSPPHPMIVCGDHSRIAERVGLPLEMYVPLYPAKGIDKVRLRRGVELLRENVLCVAVAVAAGRWADNNSFAPTLGRILSL